MIFFESAFTFIAMATCTLAALLVRKLSGPMRLEALVVFLGLMVFQFGVFGLLIHPATPFKALWLGLFMASFFFIAPALWWFSWVTCRPERPPAAAFGVGQWTTLALGVAFTLPLISSAHPGSLLVDPARSGGPLAPLIHETMIAALVLFLFQAPYYLHRTGQLLRDAGVAAGQDLRKNDNLARRSIRVVMLLILMLWLLGLARLLRAWWVQGPSPLDQVFTCVAAAVTLWAVYAILCRCLLIPETARHKSLKYAKSSLGQEAQRHIEAKLMQAMASRHLYADCDLNLAGLAGFIGETPHHVSQVINDRMNTSFSEWVNGYRVDAAREALLGSRQKTVLEVALAVEFNSKATFNAVFKRRVGTTPSAYRKSFAR